MLDRSLSLQSNVRLSSLSVECQRSLVRNVIETCCAQRGVDVEGTINGFRGSVGQQEARASIIFVLTELGMDRNSLARILGKDYVTMGTSLHRTHAKAENSPRYAEAIKKSVTPFREVTLETLWG